MLSDNDLEFLRKHRGKIILCIAFPILGILLATVGFLKTVFVLFLALLGYFIGRFLDDPESVRAFLRKYLDR